MATFLQLCRQVHRTLRVGQDPPGTAPSSVSNQQDVLAEIVEWVRDADRDIQLDQDDWLFRQATGTLQVNATREVDPAKNLDCEVVIPYTGDLCHPHILGQYADIGVTDQQPIWLVDWNDWNLYERGAASQVTGRPSRYTIAPGGLIRLYPTPDAPVTLTFRYRQSVRELLASDDVSIIPAANHDAIAWRAVMSYADSRDKTPESYQKWERRRRQAMDRLYRAQLPEFTL